MHRERNIVGGELQTVENVGDSALFTLTLPPPPTSDSAGFFFAFCVARALVCTLVCACACAACARARLSIVQRKKNKRPVLSACQPIRYRRSFLGCRGIVCGELDMVHHASHVPMLCESEIGGSRHDVRQKKDANSQVPEGGHGNLRVKVA